MRLLPRCLMMATLIAVTAYGSLVPARGAVFAEDHSARYAVEWMDLILNLARDERLSPPAASRIYGYTGVALYEALQPGMPGAASLSGQLNEMPPMPSTSVNNAAPPSREALQFFRALVWFLASNSRNTQYAVEYDWPTVTAVTAFRTTRQLFPSLSLDSRFALANLLLSHLGERAQAGVSGPSFRASIYRGFQVADAVTGWALTDGYYEIHDIVFEPPVGPQYWVPTGPVTNPLEPYWGVLRPFALETPDACKPAPPVEYSEEIGSPFYEEAYAVYEVGSNANEAEKEIAFFWADNPGQTATPPGHWVSVAGQLLITHDKNLADAAEAYALVGISVADAFVSCWDEKFRSNLLRPITYIHRVVDANWTTLIPTPPFPEYTSGHSVNSGAAAVALTRIFGDIPFTDATHVEQLGLPERYYSSFYEAAEEAAISRLYGGIHYPMGIEAGVTQGYCVGQNVVDKIQTR